MRADRVADVIKAPSLKDLTAESMLKTGKGITDDNARQEAERRKKVAYDHSQDNYQRHLKHREDLKKGSYERVDRDYVPEHVEDMTNI